MNSHLHLFYQLVSYQSPMVQTKACIHHHTGFNLTSQEPNLGYLDNLLNYVCTKGFPHLVPPIYQVSHNGLWQCWRQNVIQVKHDSWRWCRVRNPYSLS